MNVEIWQARAPSSERVEAPPSPLMFECGSCNLLGTIPVSLKRESGEIIIQFIARDMANVAIIRPDGTLMGAMAQHAAGVSLYAAKAPDDVPKVDTFYGPLHCIGKVLPMTDGSYAYYDATTPVDTNTVPMEATYQTSLVEASSWRAVVCVNTADGSCIAKCTTGFGGVASMEISQGADLGIISGMLMVAQGILGDGQSAASSYFARATRMLLLTSWADTSQPAEMAKAAFF